MTVQIKITLGIITPKQIPIMYMTEFYLPEAKDLLTKRKAFQKKIFNETLNKSHFSISTIEKVPFI